MNALMQSPGSTAALLDEASAEAEMARALAERLHAGGRRSTAELLHELRQAFPNVPLAVRVRALQALSGL
jgi:hypothetical protein